MSDNGRIAAHRGDGRVLTFTAYRADNDIKDNLYKTPSGFILESPDADQLEIYSAEGRLLSISESSGRSITLS